MVIHLARMSEWNYEKPSQHPERQEWEVMTSDSKGGSEVHPIVENRKEFQLIFGPDRSGDRVVSGSQDVAGA